MPRQPSGVGRGNGDGSRRTQFKDGMPSANPRGRPRKHQEGAGEPLQSLIAGILSESVITMEDGVRRKRTNLDAMLRLLIARYQKSRVSEQLAILRTLSAFSPQLTQQPTTPQPSEEALESLVALLAEEARREEEIARMLRVRDIATPYER